MDKGNGQGKGKASVKNAKVPRKKPRASGMEEREGQRVSQIGLQEEVVSAGMHSVVHLEQSGLHCLESPVPTGTQRMTAARRSDPN